MTSNPHDVPALVAALCAATPPPPTDRPAAEVAETGAVLVAQRQPLIDALLRALAAGARLDPDSRARLVALGELDARWRQALEEAHGILGQQIVAVQKLTSRTRAAAAVSSGARFLGIKL